MRDGFNKNPLNPCKHLKVKIVTDDDEFSVRPGRKLKRCRDCNKFIGWLEEIK